MTDLGFSVKIAKVMRMEQFLQQTLLYDFYGELLTEHQRRVYEEVVLNDISCSEAAEEFGVSRQGIHELVKRCNKILEEYESKLHLVERFLLIRENVKQIQQLASQVDSIDKEALAEQKNELYKSLLMQMSRKDLSADTKATLETLRKAGYLLAIGSSSKNTPLILR